MLKAYFKSAYLFIWGIVKRLWVWGPSFLFVLFDFFEKKIQPTLSPENKDILSMLSVYGEIALVIIILAAAIKTYHEVRVKIEPVLRIDFQNRMGSYFQEMPCTMGGEYGESFNAINQTYRICVINTGSKAIENVQVKLNTIEPASMNLFRLPLHLRFKDENEKWSKIIAGGQREFIDVVSFPKAEKSQNKFFIEHLHKDIGHIIKANKYKIEIIASGNNVPAVKKKFNIYVENDELFMVPVD